VLFIHCYPVTATLSLACLYIERQRQGPGNSFNEISLKFSYYMKCTLDEAENDLSYRGGGGGSSGVQEYMWG